MTTLNLVPRVSGTGSVGTSSLKWGSISALTGSFGSTQLEALKNGADNDLLVAGNNVTITYANNGADGNQYTISASSTPIAGVLEDLENLGEATADGEFIVATGAGAFAYESGATVRTSLGLGTIAVEDTNSMPALTMAGEIAMGTNKITGLGTPTANTDAATKAYVDANISSGGGLSFDRKSINFAANVNYHYSISTATTAITITLPAISGVNDGDQIRIYFRERASTNNITIDVASASGDLINGSGSFTLDAQYESITLVANTTDAIWEVI